MVLLHFCTPPPPLVLGLGLGLEMQLNANHNPNPNLRGRYEKAIVPKLLLLLDGSVRNVLPSPFYCLILHALCL